jgi:hypothetical protein
MVTGGNGPLATLCGRRCAIGVLAKSILAGVGIGAIVWSVIVIPAFWSENGLPELAIHVIDGEKYRSDILEALVTAEQGSSIPPSARGWVAAIRLRLAEEAVAADDTKSSDARVAALGSAIDAALSAAPTDSFMWLSLYWQRNFQEGFAQEHLRYLRSSYSLGRNEAWIAIRRNPLALAVFPELPADLAEAAVSEFVGLIRSDLFERAADILAGPGWPERHILLARLGELPEPLRRRFADVLYARGLDNVAVPGVKPPPLPPWQHK